MPEYALYNARLTTNLAVPDLDGWTATGAAWPVEVTFAARDPVPAAWTSGAWDDYPLRANQLTVWRAQAPDGWAYRLGYHSPHYRAHFTIRADLHAVWANWHPLTLTDAAVQELVCRLLAGPVLPFVLRLAGQIALHGAVVATPGGGVAFVGPSGAGKSTLATTAARRGWPTLADDVVVLAVEQGLYAAQPGPPSRHLWPATLAALQETSDAHPAVHPGTTKRHVDCTTPAAPAWASFTRTPQPLRAIFLLEPFVAADAVTSIVQTPPSLALPMLLRNRYGLVDTPPAARSGELRHLAALLDQAAVYRTVRPDRPDAHNELVDLIQRAHFI